MNLKLKQERLKTLQREATQNRLAREIQPNDDKADAFLNSVLAGLGSQLTELGSQVQEQYLELDTAEQPV